MKALIVLFLALSIIPVSIITMMLGWGLSAHNWGWIAFGYVWMVVPTLVAKVLE